LYGAVQGIEVSEDARQAAEVPEALIAALEDDLNSPKAMAEFFGLARALNKATDDETKVQLSAQMYASGELMGLLGSDPDSWFEGHVEGDLSPDDIEALIQKRVAAKAARDFASADAIRKQLSDAGISIQDGREGTTWRRS
jgi:cysteinyl-tRNA synthetase